MARLHETIVGLASARRLLEQAFDAEWRPPAMPSIRDPGFAEVVDFGPNPGNLHMIELVPDTVRPGAPLVVLLHGCLQTATGFAQTSGWSSLAARYGFALLLPEQRAANNQKNCFNWFDIRHTARDRGEALSIVQMVERTLLEHRLDRHRIYVSGLSAGGAMACALLATYPELFTGGAIIAGLPYRSAVDAKQAVAVMKHPSQRSARVWGFLVRQASWHRGRWPSVSIWQGTADRVVAGANAAELVKQWCNVHGVHEADAVCDNIGGHARRSWTDRNGRIVVEEILLEGAGHGMPIDPRGARGQALGESAPFMLDIGFGAALEIARSWGLIGRHSATVPRSLGLAHLDGAPAGLAAGALPATEPSVSGGSARRLIHRLARALGLGRGGRDDANSLGNGWEGSWQVEPQLASELEASFHACAVAGPFGSARRAMSRWIDVETGRRLNYEHRLELFAPAQPLASAEFSVFLDNVRVDHETIAFVGRANLAWTRKVIDLAPFAERRVKLRFEVAARSHTLLRARAKVWIRQIALG